MTVPHLELIGIMVCLGIASFAAWTNATLQMRVRLLERDLDIVTDNLETMQRYAMQPRTRAAISAPVAAQPPAVIPGTHNALLYAQFSSPALPSLVEQLRPLGSPRGEDTVADERPDLGA